LHRPTESQERQRETIETVRLAMVDAPKRSRPAWLQQYELVGKIGEGTYGLVFLAKSKLPANKGVHIAIKKFKQSKEGDGVSPTAIREIMVCLVFPFLIDSDLL
jgi:cyclin-dependent kinase 8/11